MKKTMSTIPSGALPSPLVFLHIPKAAGTTLVRILLQAYSGHRCVPLSGHPDDVDRFIKSPLEERNKIDFLYGHIRFGIHLFFDRPVTYITVLRDPVERAISFYYYAKKEPKHYLHKIINEGCTLHELVEKRLSIETNNDQVRWLSLLNQRLVPSGFVTRQMLAEAKHNLEQHIAAFGLAERFDDSLRLFQAVLGLPDSPYESTNTNPERPRASEIPERTLDLIREHNALDIELYEFARGLFQRRFAALDPAAPDTRFAGAAP